MAGRFSFFGWHNEASALNVSLQGQDSVVSQVYVHIEAFGTKSQLFKRHLSQTEPCIAHFPALQEVIDSLLQDDNVGAKTKRNAAAIRFLFVEFKEYFWDFAAIEKDMLLFSSASHTSNFLLFTFNGSWIKAGLQKCKYLQRKCWAHLAPHICVRRHSLPWTETRLPDFHRRDILCISTTSVKPVLACLLKSRFQNHPSH